MGLAPGTRIGPYEILGPIGAGGMGEVYRARDARLAREVALKVLPASFVADPDRLRRFEQEARATGQLNHPNILAVHDTGAHDGAPYVVEELLEGATLREKLAGGAIPARKALDYARQIAQGLAAAHQKGIVHRDLKPENLFVTTDGRVKILDFGLAKLTRPESLDGSPTEIPTRADTGAGVVLGTVGYMSPEQVRGQPTDHRSDIFSFGSILYEMLSGRRAFAGPSSVETMSAILKEEPPELSRLNLDLPPGLDRIVQHCLEKSPDERFQSIRDLAFQLEALSSISMTSAASGEGRQPALAARPGGPAARLSYARLAPWLVAGALATGVAGYFAGLQTRAPEAQATYSQMTFRQGSIFSGRFTPHGETIVYSASWDGHPAELFTASFGSPESRAMGVPSAEILSISASGEMALLLDSRYTIGWMRSGTLARAPLSGGVPRPMLQDVHDADWSPDGQSLAVVRADSGRYRLEYPAGKVLYETAAWVSSPRVSRDGKLVAFLDHPSPGDDRGTVAVVDASGRVRQLTEAFSSAASLAWSKDNGEIWFSAGRTGNVRSIYAVDLQGRLRMVDGAPADIVLADISAAGKVLVTTNTGRRGIIGTSPGDETERDLSWLDWSRPAALSADGHWVLFEEQGQGGGPGYSVYLRGTDGSPAVRLGEGSAGDLSPDGKWAATSSLTKPDQIVLLPRGAGESRTIPLPGFAVTAVIWTPDGKRLLFVASEKGELRRLYAMEAEGGTPRPVTPGGVGFAMSVSPDSRLVAVTMTRQTPEIYPIDGGEPRTVPGALPEDLPALWSADGRTLFVAVRTPPDARVDRIDLSTGQRTTWKTLRPADPAGLIDIQFIQLAGDARSYVYSYRRILSTLYLVEGLR